MGNIVLWSGRMVAAVFGGMTMATSTKIKLDNTTSYSFIITAVAWSIADILRFLFHLESMLTSSTRISVLKWLRYTVFIGLFPIGMASELVLVNAARLYKVSQGSFKWNPIIIGYMGVASIGFMYVYLHMFQQRRRHLRS
jgi:very-long-chain (3R)-3-hydroxyacyl-CoA dehydratase